MADGLSMNWWERRDSNPGRIKSPLLYQLSYVPKVGHTN